MERDILGDITLFALGDTSNLPREVLAGLEKLRDGEEKAQSNRLTIAPQRVRSLSAVTTRRPMPVPQRVQLQDASQEPVWPGEIGGSSGYSEIARNLKKRKAYLAFNERACAQTISALKADVDAIRAIKTDMVVRASAGANKLSMQASATLGDFENRAAKIIEGANGAIERAEGTLRNIRKLAAETMGLATELVGAFEEGFHFTKCTDRLLCSKTVVRIPEDVRESIRASRAKLDAIDDPLDALVYGEESHTILVEAVTEGYLRGGGFHARVGGVRRGL